MASARLKRCRQKFYRLRLSHSERYMRLESRLPLGDSRSESEAASWD